MCSHARTISQLEKNYRFVMEFTIAPHSPKSKIAHFSRYLNDAVPILTQTVETQESVFPCSLTHTLEYHTCRGNPYRHRFHDKNGWIPISSFREAVGCAFCFRAVEHKRLYQDSDREDQTHANLAIADFDSAYDVLSTIDDCCVGNKSMIDCDTNNRLLEVLSLRGEWLLILKKYEDALRDFTQLIKMGRANEAFGVQFSAVSQRATCLWRLGQIPEAKKHFEWAQRLENENGLLMEEIKHVEFHEDLGSFFAEEFEDWTNALSHYRVGLKLLEDNRSAFPPDQFDDIYFVLHDLQIRTLARTLRLDEMTRMIDSVERKYSNRLFHNYAKMGTLLNLEVFKRSFPEKPSTYFNKAFQNLDPDIVAQDPKSLFVLAELGYDLGFYDKAIRLCRLARALLSKGEDLPTSVKELSFSNWMCRAKCLVSLDRNSEAVDCLDSALSDTEAVQSNSHVARMLLLKARCSVKLRDFTSARRILRQIRREDLEGAELQAELLQCEQECRSPPQQPQTVQAEPEVEIKSHCWACGSVPSRGGKFKVCSRCRNARYCSRDCQGGDWKKHRRTCRRRE